MHSLIAVVNFGVSIKHVLHHLHRRQKDRSLIKVYKTDWVGNCLVFHSHLILFPDSQTWSVDWIYLEGLNTTIWWRKKLAWNHDKNRYYNEILKLASHSLSCRLQQNWFCETR